MMKVTELFNDAVYFLTVESHYYDPAEAKGKNDAVVFEMGQGKEIDSTIICSVTDARAFAEAILRICSEIEGDSL